MARVIKHWVCDVQTVGSGEPAIEYLARYVTKTAIGSRRLRIEGEDTETKVVFDYIDSDTKKQQTCRLEPFEFLRRFLQHVLPRRFRAVRSFGWMSPAAKNTFDKISLWLKGIDYRTPAFVVDWRYPKCRKCGRALLPTSDEVPDDLRLASVLTPKPPSRSQPLPPARQNRKSRSPTPSKVTTGPRKLTQYRLVIPLTSMSVRRALRSI